MASKNKMRKLSAGGILTSMASGATTGSAAGPIGTVAGAAIGAGVGIYQHTQEEKAKRAAQDRLITQSRLDRQMQFRNNLQQPIANTPMPLLPLGGLVPYNNETVELERGEPFQTPDGQINGIPNNAPTHAQGGVPITLPSGTKVLGKKPATNEKTFKQLGSKLEKQQKKYQKILDNNPSRIQEQTSKRMLAKIKTQFDDLFELQGEDTQPNQQFPNGGTVGNSGFGKNLNDSFTFTPEQIRTAQINTPISQQALRDPNTGQIIAYEQFQKGVKGPQYIPVDTNIQDTISPNVSNGVQGSLSLDPNTQQFACGGKVRKGQDGLLTSNRPSQFQVEDPLYTAPTTQQYQINQNVSPSQPIGDSNLIQPQGNQFAQGQFGNFKGGTALNTLASLAPTVYNLYQGAQKPDQVATNAFRNPYEREARATLRDRRFNIQPELEAARLRSATFARNLREGAPSQAQYLGGLQAGAISEQRNIGQILARKQNIENELKAQQAQADISLGQADVQRQQYIEDINARSRAATKRFTTAGLSQLGQFAQVNQQMNNQMIRDAQRLNTLPALVQNFTLGEDGQWRFKDTNEVVDPSIVSNYVRGQNIR